MLNQGQELGAALACCLVAVKEVDKFKLPELRNTMVWYAFLV